jgi:hypothetical protein
VLHVGCSSKSNPKVCVVLSCLELQASKKKSTAVTVAASKQDLHEHFAWVWQVDVTTYTFEGVPKLPNLSGDGKLGGAKLPNLGGDGSLYGAADGLGGTLNGF